jgi:hypothetical protein
VYRSKLLAAALSLGLIACTSAEAKPIRGLYFWGHEVETFHPCGSDKAYWVVGEESLLQPLRDKAKEASAARPYQPIYVEVVVVPEGKATDGFAADYDGVYRFKSVATVSYSPPPGCVADG